MPPEPLVTSHLALLPDERTEDFNLLPAELTRYDQQSEMLFNFIKNKFIKILGLFVFALLQL